MDKWKDVELEKMKVRVKIKRCIGLDLTGLTNNLALLQVGGNRKFKEFLQAQSDSDWDEGVPLQQKYNSQGAALYREKVRKG